MTSRRKKERLWPLRPWEALITRSGWAWREGLNPSRSPGLAALSTAAGACLVSLEAGVLKFGALVRFYNRSSQFKAGKKPLEGERRWLGGMREMSAAVRCPEPWNPETQITQLLAGFARGLSPTSLGLIPLPTQVPSAALIHCCWASFACRDHTGPSTSWGHLPPLSKECKKAKGTEMASAGGENGYSCSPRGEEWCEGGGNLKFHLEVLSLKCDRTVVHDNSSHSPFQEICWKSPQNGQDLPQSLASDSWNQPDSIFHLESPSHRAVGIVCGG